MMGRMSRTADTTRAGEHSNSEWLLVAVREVSASAADLEGARQASAAPSSRPAPPSVDLAKPRWLQLCSRKICLP
jgi:hypothetical protein